MTVNPTGPHPIWAIIAKLANERNHIAVAVYIVLRRWRDEYGDKAKPSGYCLRAWARGFAEALIFARDESKGAPYGRWSQTLRETARALSNMPANERAEKLAGEADEYVALRRMIATLQVTQGPMTQARALVIIASKSMELIGGRPAQHTMAGIADWLCALYCATTSREVGFTRSEPGKASFVAFATEIAHALERAPNHACRIPGERLLEAAVRRRLSGELQLRLPDPK